MTGRTPILQKKVKPVPTTDTLPNSQDKPIPIYKYPENLLTEYLDYLQIDTFKYVSLTEYYSDNDVQFTTNSNGAAVPRSAGSTQPPIKQTNSLLKGYVAGEGFGGRGTATQRFLRGRTINTFQLPIPDAIQINDAPMWNLEDLRTMGKFLPTFGKQFATGDMSSAADTLKNLAEGAKPEIILGLAEQSQFFSSKEAITQGFAGRILNPYYEMIFKGIQPRTFSCRYKLVPRNRIEQSEISNIIQFLRVNSLPNYSKQSTTDDVGQNTFDSLGDRWLTTPNIFNLRFLSRGKDILYLPKMKPMVCTNVSTNYTPDNGWFTHAANDNMPCPVAIELTLNFNEVEIIVATEVAQDGF